MNLNLVEEVTASQLRDDIPDFKAGDTVRVSVRIIENKKNVFKTTKALLSNVVVMA